MEVEDLGTEEGLGDFKKPTKTLLVDADTIVYASCSSSEYAEEIMPDSFYTEEELAAIKGNPGYDEEGACIWHTDLEEAFTKSVERVKELQEITFTKDVELYFTSGRNFRYEVYDMYKGNRKKTRYPMGLSVMKDRMLAEFKGENCTEYEADDYCVLAKQHDFNSSRTYEVYQSLQSHCDVVGISRTKELWNNMLKRCYREDMKSAQYKEAGIKVYKGWHTFSKFKKFMDSLGYAEGLELDRINNEGNYDPSNVQLLTSSMNKAKQNLVDNRRSYTTFKLAADFRSCRNRGLNMPQSFKELGLEFDVKLRDRITKRLIEIGQHKTELDYIASRLDTGIEFVFEGTYYRAWAGTARVSRGLVMTAVDKDVLKSVPGKHFNYYRSERYGIDMKWQETDVEDAYKFAYIQTLMGDISDNIPGCKGVGPAKAKKALEGFNTPLDLWNAVVKTFKSKGLTEKEAIRDMRLVNMHQLTIDKKIVLWNPPTS